MLADAELIPFFDNKEVILQVREEIHQELLAHGIDHDGGLRMPQAKVSDVGRMIGFHVVHDEVVKRPAVKQELDILKEQFGDRRIDRVEDACLLVEIEERVVACPIGNRINILK